MEMGLGAELKPVRNIHKNDTFYFILNSFFFVTLCSKWSRNWQSIEFITHTESRYFNLSVVSKVLHNTIEV